MKLLQGIGALAVPLLVWPTLAFGQNGFSIGNCPNGYCSQGGFSFSIGNKSDKLPVGPWYLYWPLEAHFQSAAPGLPPGTASPMACPPQFAPRVPAVALPYGMMPAPAAPYGMMPAPAAAPYGMMPGAGAPYGMVPARWPNYPPAAAAPYAPPMPYAPANPLAAPSPDPRTPTNLPPLPTADSAAGPRPVSYWMPAVPAYWYGRQ
jgi:hypothetical protein